MKRIIDGRTYDIDSATRLAKYEYESDKGHDTDAVIYKTRGGAFFVVHIWETKQGIVKQHFEAIEYAELQHIVTKQDNLEVYDEDALTVPPEAQLEAEPAATLYIRVPNTLKKRVDEAAKGENLSGNAWAMRCVERCLRDPRKLLDDLLRIHAVSFSASHENDWNAEKYKEACAEIFDWSDSQLEKLCGEEKETITVDFIVEANSSRDFDITERFQQFTK